MTGCSSLKRRHHVRKQHFRSSKFVLEGYLRHFDIQIRNTGCLLFKPDAVADISPPISFASPSVRMTTGTPSRSTPNNGMNALKLIPSAFRTVTDDSFRLPPEILASTGSSSASAIPSTIKMRRAKNSSPRVASRYRWSFFLILSSIVMEQTETALTLPSTS